MQADTDTSRFFAAQKGYGYKCRNLAKYGEVKHSSKPKTNIPVSPSRQLSFGDF